MNSFSGSRFGGWYFLVQALGIAGWWVYLSAEPSAVPLFLPRGAAEADLRAFQMPDLLVAVPVSLAAAVSILLSLRWAMPLAWFAAGAMVYAFIYCVGWSMWRGGGWLNVALMAPAALFSTIGALDVSAGSIPIFRRAAPGHAVRHVAATLAQIVVFWSFFLFVVPSAIVFVERQLRWPSFAFTSQRLLAAVLFVVFSSLGLASGVTMAGRGAGTPLPFIATNRLVTTGPYSYLRNPMVVAGLGQGLAVALWLGSWAVLAYVIVGGLIWEYLVRPAEERDLRDAFGDEFETYSQHVRCWIPRTSAFRRVTT
ncbi:MAG TPA: isoprenylcysteine carboxylmethyltransferase family protein [Vicinamibacterales bacterium]|nr:isoprenylcysteine carboxylmethyltransferase family protein [Vicinamibacterales bacterium]